MLSSATINSSELYFVIKLKPLRVNYSHSLTGLKLDLTRSGPKLPSAASTGNAASHRNRWFSWVSAGFAVRHTGTETRRANNSTVNSRVTRKHEPNKEHWRSDKEIMRSEPRKSRRSRSSRSLYCLSQRSAAMSLLFISYITAIRFSSSRIDSFVLRCRMRVIAPRSVSSE